MHVWKIWKALERKLYYNLTGHLGLVHMLYQSQQFLHKHNKLPYIFINIFVSLLDLMKLKGLKIICPRILPFGHKNLDFCDFKMARKPHLWKTLRLDTSVYCYRWLQSVINSRGSGWTNDGISTLCVTLSQLG